MSAVHFTPQGEIAFCGRPTGWHSGLVYTKYPERVTCQNCKVVMKRIEERKAEPVSRL